MPIPSKGGTRKMHTSLCLVSTPELVTELCFNNKGWEMHPTKTQGNYSCERRREFTMTEKCSSVICILLPPDLNKYLLNLTFCLSLCSALEADSKQTDRTRNDVTVGELRFWHPSFFIIPVYIPILTFFLSRYKTHTLK